MLDNESICATDKFALDVNIYRVTNNITDVVTITEAIEQSNGFTIIVTHDITIYITDNCVSFDVTNVLTFRVTNSESNDLTIGVTDSVTMIESVSQSGIFRR